MLGNLKVNFYCSRLIVFLDKKMSDSSQRRINEHSRTAPSHYAASLFPPRLTVAMHGTPLTARLSLAEAAVVETAVCVFQEINIFPGDFLDMQLLSAV